MTRELPSVRACREGVRKLALWDPKDPRGTYREVPWTCNSWRCRRCRARVALRDYSRICWALEQEPRWVYAVLTAPSEVHKGKAEASYRYLAEAWTKRLRHRIARRWGKVLYVQTWERHRSGIAHVNVALRSSKLIEELERDELAQYRFRAWLLEQAEASGFGRVGWVSLTWEPKPGAERPLAGLASYMTKLAHGLGVDKRTRRSIAAELGRPETKDQTPIEAPRGFRRLRTSKGVLPRKRKAGLAGLMLKRGQRFSAERAMVRSVLECLQRAEASWEQAPSGAASAVSRKTCEASKGT